MFGQAPAPTDTQPAPQDIRQNNPGFLVRADVNKGSRSYREGDTLYVQVATEEEAYVYVLYQQADGKIFQIFPNDEQRENQIPARQVVQIPAADNDLFRWVVGPPFGKEVIKVLASKQPLEGLSDPALREKFFNRLSPAQAKGIALELGPADPTWAEDTVEIMTYARDQQQPAGVQRWGVFFGIGEYAFHDDLARATEGKAMLNQLPAHRDARQLAAVLQEVGQLSDLRVYTNEQATRENLEEALTRWLPGVSRPGDVVVIYFSGRVLLLPPDPANRGAAVLAPYDFLPWPALDSVLKRAKENQGQVAANLAPFIERAIAVVKQAGSEERAAVELVRQTGVPQPLLAHWLQRLAGRQVVLILDTAHAGAWGPQAAQGVDDKSVSGNQLWGDGVNRLKGLGQQEIALLGACGPRDTDVLRVPEDLSLMTLCLTRWLAQTPGPLTVEQAHQVLACSMETLFTERNDKLQADGNPRIEPYRPYYESSCTRPVVIKP
jgi:hypothetical protein